MLPNKVIDTDILTKEDMNHNDLCPLIRTVGLTRDYPGLRALDNVNFDLMAGEVHILFGENGAGKSTLISMLAGSNTPTSGEILFNGESIQLDNVHQAREIGISAVFQEFSLIPQMTVAENLFLGAEEASYGFFNPKTQIKLAESILDNLDFHVNPVQRVDHLSRAEQQMVEISKAFRSDLSVLILDEPTASLTSVETERLFSLIEKLKKQQVGIIYITHRTDEIRQIGDRITILRDGRFIATVDAKNTSEDELVHLMTGRVVGDVFPRIEFKPNETILEVENLCTADQALRDICAYVRRGEIVGIAGLVGSGKSKFGQACFGSIELSSGRIKFKDKHISKPKVREMLINHLLYLPADRRNDGLMLMRPARENMSLAALGTREFSNGWVLNRKHELKSANQLSNKLNLSPRRIELTAEHFSGGNQQKLMLARSLTKKFDLIIFDEPTVGVDVGTRAAIYEFIAELCANGAAIMLISSDLPEVLNLSNRVYVFYQGTIQAELEGDEATETNVLPYFFGKEATSMSV